MEDPRRSPNFFPGLDPTLMQKILWILVLGLSVALGATLVVSQHQSQDVERLQHELTDLRGELAESQRQVDKNQAALQSQAEALHQGLSRAAEQIEDIAKSQRSAAERLRAAAKVLRDLEP